MQRRSRERVERILDACAELLDEVGSEGLTVTEVARRAGVPSGTVYQFFDGRLGLLRQLALRHLEILLGRLRARAAAEPGLTWPRAGEIVIDETVRMRRVIPGFTVVDFGEARPGGEKYLPEGTTEAGGDIMAESLYRFAVEEAGLPPLADPYRVTSLAIQAAAVGIDLAFRTSRDGDPAMIEQTRRLLSAYFADAARRLPPGA
ncbi:TetR family transcriptional regulator [Actinocorallia herbida]|uniref:TetR family transcriptional regulator n=1 Tax=Actinocorallia herbida TaxID=58109 RepID=A0A3N1CWG3_9ACTN|nr:TetR/AcrR family transcriptional regulator [Actinocorallia herbida]ROO85627.1 TetR family transcriptional regulator [Actinocorallia herbida]